MVKCLAASVIVAASLAMTAPVWADTGAPDYLTIARYTMTPVPDVVDDTVPFYGAKLPWSYLLVWFGPVVRCESGGQWHAHRDGAFQIIPSTWRANGGPEFAPFAGDASPVDQYTIAVRVFDRQGARAWTCRGAK